MWQCLSPPAFDAPLTDWLCLQNVWCGRTEIREEEVDSLFWGCDGHYLHRGHEWIRLNAGGRPGNGEMTRRKEKKINSEKKKHKKTTCQQYRVCQPSCTPIQESAMGGIYEDIQMAYKKQNNMGIKHSQSIATVFKVITVTTRKENMIKLFFILLD